MAEHQLSILVRAKDLASGALRNVSRELSGLDRAGPRAAKSLGGLHGAMGRVQRGLGGLIGGPAGLIGLGAGLFSVEHMLTGSIEKAQEFGKVVMRMSAMTGLSAETTSELAAAMEHFGIDAETELRLTGMLEKNVGLLTSTKKKSAAFEKTFGFALVDANGHVKDANQLILQAADYFNNKQIPAQTKAAALSKLFGRNWQEMVPILSAGSAGIQSVEEEAKRLGLTLTSDNIAALKKSRDATREWNTALGGLQLQIGVGLLPEMTDLAHAATEFVAGHRDDIVKFFKDGAQTARGLANAIKDDVVPWISRIAGAWNAIPPDMKKILVGGFVANKLSGGLVVDLGKEVIGKGLGGLFSRGASPAAPLYVRDVGIGKGLPGAPVPGGGGLGTLGKVALIGEAIGLVAAVEGVRETISADNSKIASGLQQQTAQYLAHNPSKADLQNSLGAVEQGINQIRSNPLNVLVQGDALDKLTQMRADIAAQLYAMGQIPAAVAAAAAAAIAHDPKAAEASRQFDAGANQGFNDQSPAMIAAFSAQAQALAKLHSDFLSQIGALRRLPDRGFASRGFALEHQILRSHESARNKIADLTGIQRAFMNRGDTHSAAKIGRDLAAVRATIAHKKLSVTVKNTVLAKTTFSVRDVMAQQVRVAIGANTSNITGSLSWD